MSVKTFLKPHPTQSPEESLHLEEVTSILASKESPLHASPHNSSWEIFLGILILVLVACACAKYDTLKIKGLIVWSWIKDLLLQLKKRLDKKD
jgi:hypothetical protein